MSTLYDSLPFNMYCEFHTPYREGVGTITQDVSKNHSVVTLVNAPTWSQLDTGKNYLSYNGTTQYAEAQDDTTANLNFTTGGYSLGGWFNWTDGGTAQNIMGRYELSVSGWELYLYGPGGDLLNLRHHHAGGTDVRSSAYSTGWTDGVWWFFGVSREAGGQATFYRNGQAITTVSVLEDIETETRDLTIGTRYCKTTNFFKGGRTDDRGWSTALTADDWLTIYELEKGWFA